MSIQRNNTLTGVSKLYHYKHFFEIYPKKHFDRQLIANSHKKEGRAKRDPLFYIA